MHGCLSCHLDLCAKRYVSFRARNPYPPTQKKKARRERTNKTARCSIYKKPLPLYMHPVVSTNSKG